MLGPSALAVLAGLAHAAAMGSPWDGQALGWLQLVAMGTLTWQLEGYRVALHSARRPTLKAAWLGWLFTTAWLAGTFWWLYVSMHTYGGLNAAVTVVAIGALAGVLALYYTAAVAVFARLAPANPAGAATLFAALWTMAELCRGTWFTGFGWGAAGYAHLDGLAVFAPWVGSYGVGALAAFLACLIGVSLRRGWAGESQVGNNEAANQVALSHSASFKSASPAIFWLAPTVALAAFAALNLEAVRSWVRPSFSTAGQNLSVALLQGNIAQNEKFQPSTGIADALAWYGGQISQAKASLVVAPETALPLLPTQLPDDYWQSLAAQVAGDGKALLVGIPLGSYKDGYTNSVVGLHAGPAYQYDKHHLVPFGEFIPPLFRWFTQLMNIPLGDFNRGAVGQASFEIQGQRLAPNICYEDLFGEELGARFADPAKSPTIFVNVSNIGWFGNTVAIDQHLGISRMRAMEFERPFIRATNTGATVVIDHTGRVTHALARHTRGVLLAEVQGRSGAASNGFGLTPFARWVSHLGLWPFWLCGLGIVLLAWRASQRKGRSEGDVNRF